MERIHVTVRARPLSPEDARTSPWRISGNSVFIPNYSTKFEFDRVFGEECKTKEVYRARTNDIVAAAVRGFNGTVFAYGQTNSGKTHTMRGSASEPGVIPLGVQDLFNTIQEDVDREFLLRMSYMEIYNEDINDLLAPEHRKLQIHESVERGIYVAGLREEIVASPQQVLDLMQFGESHRHIGETNMNLYSSRSHTIFRMIIESRDRTEDLDLGSSCDAVRVSVLNLVDLAGSERAAKTGAEGVRLKEGSHINKSLMTLGTVIKKLSEGAESLGGHVPYRDSKLTRILQPALGGNANTAIICNITLAQIHADETKSSLQFASRALRVTNCAHVNEILTDAALLKRQKREIEELRAKLQGSHSEHLEEEILNLRNTLLKSELERERISLELEEEKRAQAEREKVLQEQAKKIKNLSSMVLYSGRDVNRDQHKKGKRRDTWCPGNLSRETLEEVDLNIQSRPSALGSMRPSRDMGPLLPFEELVNEIVVQDDFSQQHEDHNNNSLADCILPDPCALLHVTNRRKVPPRKNGSLVEDHEVIAMQAEYEELLLKFETQRTMSEIQIDCLTKQLAEAEFFQRVTYNDCSINHFKGSNNMDKNMSLRESEAILVIKQLQEKIKILEMETSSSQQNLNNIVDLATEQSICAHEKFEKLQEELQKAWEEAKVAREQLACDEFARINDFSMEIEDIMSEVQSSMEVVESVSALVNEVFQSFSTMFNVFSDFKVLMCQTSDEQKLIVNNHEKLYCSLKHKVSVMENEKLDLYSQSLNFQKQIQELMQDAQNHEESLKALSKQHELGKVEYLSTIEILEKEIAYLSSGPLAKEKEHFRKDLEKTKAKLKETEFKLKNAVQEKTKLEGEKAAAEREVKRLHSQKLLLERDVSKRDSIAGRRCDSVFERSSNVPDPKRAKGLAASFEQTMQEDYRKLEVLAFEMEATIASLEEELVLAQKEKEDAVSRNQAFSSELEAMSDKLDASNTELNVLQEEVSLLRSRLDESAHNQKDMESSIKLLEEQKEELAMQLTDSLLDMEEEKAIWFAKEKVSIEAIEEKENLYKSEVALLSKTLSQVNSELGSCKEECKVLSERLPCSGGNASWEIESSMEKSLEIDQLKKRSDVESKNSEVLDTLSTELHFTCGKADVFRKEMDVLNKEREWLSRIRGSEQGQEFWNDFQILQDQLLSLTKERDELMLRIEEYQTSAFEMELLRRHSDETLFGAKAQVEELSGRISSMETKMQKDEFNNCNEKAKLRMRLRGTQAKLDAFRFRYKELVGELDLMNRKFEAASKKLKDQLASYGIENLNLKKQLASITR